MAVFTLNDANIPGNVPPNADTVHYDFTEVDAFVDAFLNATSLFDWSRCIIGTSFSPVLKTLYLSTFCWIRQEGSSNPNEDRVGFWIYESSLDGSGRFGKPRPIRISGAIFDTGIPAPTTTPFTYGGVTYDFVTSYNLAIARLYVAADGSRAFYNVYWSSTTEFENLGDPNNPDIKSYIRVATVNPDGSFVDLDVPRDIDGNDINRVGINLITDLTADGTLYLAFMAGTDQDFFDIGQGGAWQFTFQLSYQFLETVTNGAGEHSWQGEIAAVVPQ